MVKAVIIDDELHCINTLSMLLKAYCPDVHVVAACQSPVDGKNAIETLKPDLVFLDIEMPEMNGFKLLEQLHDIFFALIFTTGYDQYAIRAIKFSALDYLMKPIDPNELISAIKKVQEQRHLPFAEQFQMLLKQIHDKNHQFNKLAVPTSDGFELISIDQLLWCNADDNYTHFYLKNKTHITVCRTLKEVEELLKGFEFFIRVHHSHIVNLKEVTRYVRGEGGYLVLSDGTSVNVSRTRKDMLLNTFLPNKH
jgi:two-component system LytT family response regulator